MFDGMEMGLFPLVGRDALQELLRDQLRALPPDAALELLNLWFGVVMACFLIGAATGGVVFGWLGDKVGRVRAMTVSVMLYSTCSGLSAASQSPAQLAGLRFFGALGMGGEWALGVALVMEVWPNASRAWLAGWIGAFGNLGYTACGLIALGLTRINTADLTGGLTAAGVPGDWADALTANRNWRLLMLVGAVPALLTLFIRLFVPESEKWEKEKAAGAASHWSGYDLLAVLAGAAAAGGVVALWASRNIPLTARLVGSAVGLVAVVLGYLYPAQRYLRRANLPPTVRRQTLGRMLLAAGLSGVPLLATWAGVMWMYQWVGKLPGGDVAEARPMLQISSSLGAAAGCVVAAVLGGRFGRRVVYLGLCVVSLVTIVGFYQLNTAYNPAFVISAGWLGFVTAGFYGWLPLYLPELFRTSVRATGQGFGFNFGRIIAAAGNLQMANLLALFGNDYARACAVVAGVYVFGILLLTVAPETKGKPLPE
jgi:MFS family permease